MLPAVESRSIVIAGMGVVTPNGIGVEVMWQNALNGKTGISSVSPEYSNIKVAGQITDFNPSEVFRGILNEKELKKLDDRYARATQLGLAAAFPALYQANVLGSDNKILPEYRERIGTQIGTGGGGTSGIGPDYKKMLEGGSLGTAVLKIQPETVSTALSILVKAEGPLSTNVAACATGLDALIRAVDIIRLDQADGMIAGGTEASLVSQVYKYFESIHALSPETDPDRASRPFDRKRNGFVMSEGAGVIFLATEALAKKLHAPILGRILGYGATADAYKATEPSGVGSVSAMRKALGMAGMTGEDNYYLVKAHATSTLKGDDTEMEGIREVFPKPDRVAITAPKSSLGHTMGASGVIETIVTIKALLTGNVPPTLHLEDPDPSIEGYNVVANEAQYLPQVDVGVNNSFGFGGINTCLVIGKP